MEETKPLNGMTSPHVKYLVLFEDQVQQCYSNCDQQREETGSCHQIEPRARAVVRARGGGTPYVSRRHAMARSPSLSFCGS